MKGSRMEGVETRDLSRKKNKKQMIPKKDSFTERGVVNHSTGAFPLPPSSERMLSALSIQLCMFSHH